MRHDLVIAIPTDKPLGKQYEDWLRKVSEEVATLLPQYEICVYVNQQECVSTGLNAIAHYFLQNKNASWLWIAKTDLQWNANDLAELVRTCRPIIGVLSTACEEWPSWQASFFDGLNASEDGVMQVPEVSGNGLLVHRTVFERILMKPPFALEYRDEHSWQPHNAFFQQARVSFNGVNRLLREEHFFQWLCRESGIGIFVHTKIRLKRLGPDGVAYPKLGQEPNLISSPPRDAGQWPIVKQYGTFVICLQYWDGDKEDAEKLAAYIRELGSTRTEFSLVMVPSPPGLKYPLGPNTVAFNLIREAAEGLEWARGAKCILLMEPDCVPVARDWIDQLSDEWDRAAGMGKLVLGHWRKEHGGHVNGNLLFSPDLARKISIGRVPRRPWDIAVAPLIEPICAKTGLIKNLYRRTSVSAEEMQTPSCGNKPPVLIHGVRDQSAWDYAKAKL